MTRKRRKNSEMCDQVYSLKIFQFNKVDDGDIRPVPRSGHRIEYANSCLYSIGGYNPDPQYELFHEVWRFDFSAYVWEKLETENLPEELASCYTVVSGRLLFLQGGTGVPFGTKLNESLHICNLPKTGTKITFNELKATTYDCPPPRYGHCMALSGNQLYVVGGTTGHTYSLDVYSFNLETREWTKLYDTNFETNNPRPRYRHEIVCYKNRLYVFGGGTQGLSFSLKELPTFNLLTNQWEILKTFGHVKNVDEEFPSNRKCHGCVQNPHLPSLVYVNGGCGNHETLRDTWQIDLDTLRWTCVKSMELPHGVHFHSVAVSPNGRMFVFGGITDEHNPPERTANLYSAWINIPSLADVCMEALQHYFRNGMLPEPKSIRSLGLPKQYEDRLTACRIFSDPSSNHNSDSDSE